MLGLAACGGAALAGAAGCAKPRGLHEYADDEVLALDIDAAAHALRSRELSPVELTRASLERIARLNGELRAYITVASEQALASARLAEREIAKGKWRGPLHGVPIGIKDNIDTAGVETTAASRVLSGRTPSRDADVVRQLKAAGAVLLGKHNLHEFALGTTSAISAAGAVHNPWDLERISGGSSGGTAAAVAANLGYGGVATDTGGSIRIPSACCGVVGFKPSYGIISTAGVIPVSQSFDHVGPICRSATDAALMFRAMTNHAVAAAVDAHSPVSISQLRIGVCPPPCTMCEAQVDDEVMAAVDDAVEVLRTLVAQVRPYEIAEPTALWALLDAETAAFHARYLASAPDRYDARTLADLRALAVVAPAEQQRMRAALAQHRASMQSALRDVDILVMPTVPGLPPTLIDAVEPFALASCTGVFNSGGLPAISIPCGLSSSGLPIGLQIAGRPLADAQVLALAQRYQELTHWHQQRPRIAV